MKVATEKPVNQMDIIRHLVQDVSRVQREIRPLPEGPSREAKRREWAEISATLDSHMKRAKYFNLHDFLYLKYLSIQKVEIVDTFMLTVGFGDFNDLWMDMLYLAEVTSEIAYSVAVDEVIEKGGTLS
ncbi:hypothetical protein [Hymenobacter nivis]|uniref:Uncharacterized protein n=1 Tax=Hymenobacter nivis TaxID=1850093 RepID=A0A502HBI4_9BACT|nr:hypothetical protein [Hymenobacter nivis]TPG72007.1 hypothetical protein EAH73_01815 [Hymenobacter nivis]